MTLGELRALFRREAGDQTQPYLWSDAEVKEFANEAEREACRRADLLIDSTTPKFCTVSVKAGAEGFSLQDQVIDIRRMRVQGQGLTVDPTFAEELDGLGDWESQTGAEILYYVPGLDTAHIRLYPIPSQDIVVRLTVSRLPKREMEDKDDQPEIMWRHHRKLVYWMLRLAYQKQDSEGFDPAKAERAELEFVREFGQSRSARNEQWQRTTTFGLPDALV